MRMIRDWDAEVQSFDFETSGQSPEYALQPWRRRQLHFWATSLAAVRRAPGNPKFVVSGGLAPRKSDMAAMLEEAIANRRVMLGWNVVFDISVFLAYGLRELVMQLDWFDGMLIWKHADVEPEYDMERHRKRSYGLKTCVKELFPQWGDYADDVDFHDPDPEARRKLHQYNVRDCGFAYHCARWFWGQLEPAQRRACAIEAATLPMLAEANLEGMMVDTLAANELAAQLVGEANRCFRALDADVLASPTAQAALTEKKVTPENVTAKIVKSPVRLAKLLYDDWGLPVLKENRGKKTGNVSRSTGKEVLHELAFTDSRAKLLKQFREALNNRTKFAAGPVASVAYNGDDHTHPLAMPFGTYTGRVTYASKQGKGVGQRPIGFAIQQEKRGEEYRRVLKAPPGYRLIEFDAAGQEFRWMAIKADDDTMLSLCLPGEDPHGYMGARIYQEDYRALVAAVREKDKLANHKRKLGKLANLSLQYRTSAPRLRIKARVDYDLPMEMDEAELIHRTYVKTYTKVPRYWRTQVRNVRKLGYAETFAGRRIKVEGDWNGNMAWKMEGTAINYPIQGTGADQKYLAIALIKDRLNAFDGRFWLDLHDGLYLLAPVAKAEAAFVAIQRTLDNLPYKKAWGFTPPIPLPWDGKIGTTWGNLAEFKG